MTAVMDASMLQRLVRCPSLVPPPAFLTGKPFPSTSLPGWRHSHQHHRHRQHQQLFRRKSRSLLWRRHTTITADVSDLAGNSATQATDTTSKDTAAPSISVAINDGGDGFLKQKIPLSPSLAPPPAFPTDKPFPSTSPLGWRHSHQHHRHRQHQQPFRHRPRSLLNRRHPLHHRRCQRLSRQFSNASHRYLQQRHSSSHHFNQF